jgi:choline dehydrogenase-like flavoprotein
MLTLDASRMGYYKADEVLETPEYRDVPATIQEHIAKPTVPLYELTTWSTPFTPLADPNALNYTAIVFLQCPQSRGSVKLASADPKDPPLIDLNFLDHPFDRRLAVVAGRRLLDFVESKAMRERLLNPIIAPASRSEEDILAWWRAYGSSTWLVPPRDLDENAADAKDARPGMPAALSKWVLVRMHVSTLTSACEAYRTFVSPTCRQRLSCRTGQ